MKAEYKLTRIFQITAIIAVVLSIANGSALIMATLFAVFAYPVIIVCFAAQLAYEWYRDRRES